MRACRIGVIATLTLSVILSIVLATFEVIASTDAIAVNRAVRSWGIAILIIAIVAAIGLAILDRQVRILDRLNQLENAKPTKSRARAELDAVQRRLNNDDGGNITPLYPEE